jgi:TRAP-type C4-dicarboxylate transport system permease large subunit
VNFWAGYFLGILTGVGLMCWGVLWAVHSEEKKLERQRQEPVIGSLHAIRPNVRRNGGDT